MAFLSDIGFRHFCNLYHRGYVAFLKKKLEIGLSRKKKKEEEEVCFTTNRS